MRDCSLTRRFPRLTPRLVRRVMSITDTRTTSNGHTLVYDRGVRTDLSELASRLGTTDRTLRRALRQGLLRAERPSPRIVDLPFAERAYLVRAWPLLSELRAALRTEPSVRLAVLFGSRARGDDRDGSDIDLLVALEPGTASPGVRRRLADQISARIELVDLEEAERAPILLAEILGDGRVLVDRDEMWPRLLDDRERVERASARERRRIDQAFENAFALQR